MTVRAPNRERLLADMNGALSGLGLLVHDARFTSGDMSEYAAYVFVVQVSSLPTHAHHHAPLPTSALSSALAPALPCLPLALVVDRGLLGACSCCRSLLAVRPRRCFSTLRARVRVRARARTCVLQECNRYKAPPPNPHPNPFLQDSNGHKVLERSRLEAIRQRLQQKYWGSQGLNGGVRRLVVDRYIAARPPWEHDTLAPQEPPQLQVEIEIGIELSPAPSPAPSPPIHTHTHIPSPLPSTASSPSPPPSPSR